jgi:hypothetical protein
MNRKESLVRKARRFLTAVIAAGAAIFGSSKVLNGQSLYCFGTHGCCTCEEDFWGNWMCYDEAVYGFFWCTSYFTYCELWDPFCVWGGGLLAPDGSLYTDTLDESSPMAELRTRTVKVTDGVEWEVICSGVIVNRRYSLASLAIMVKRLERMTI